MALSLKGNDEQNNEEMLKNDLSKADTGYADDKQSDDFSDLETPAYKPVVISTEVIKPVGLDSKKNDITGIIIKAVVAVIICLVAFTVGKALVKKLAGPKDITDYVNKSESEIEKALGVNLVDSPEKVSSVHQYSNGKISVSSDGNISVVYIDGVQKGVKIDNKKYTMFGIKIGDSGNHISDKFSYDYENSFVVLNDLMSGKSTTEYYYNRSKNDCFIVIINEDSGRVVSMSYYNDFQLISENLSGIDDD